MATHSSILVWRIPWTEEPGRLQFIGSQRVGHDWATSLSLSFQYSITCIYHISFIHSCVSGHLGISTSLLLWIMLHWRRGCRYLYGILISILLDIHPGKRLLYHIVLIILLLISWGNFMLFFIKAAPIFIPVGGVQRFLFLHILANTCYLILLTIVILIGVRWCLTALHFPAD